MLNPYLGICDSPLYIAASQPLGTVNTYVFQFTSFFQEQFHYFTQLIIIKRYIHVSHHNVNVFLPLYFI
jgi:hypothetical protein